MPVLDQTSAIDLEVPFCVQVSGESFTVLHALLELLMPLAVAAPPPPSDAPAAPLPASPSASAALASALRLVKANFQRLQLSRVSPSDVGALDAAGNPTPAVAGLHRALRALMHPTSGYPPGVQLLAAQAIDAGMEVLHSTPDLRADLLSALIAQHSAAGSAMSLPEATLLASCLRRFTTPAGVLGLVPRKSPAGSAPARPASEQQQRVVRLLGDMVQVRALRVHTHAHTHPRTVTRTHARVRTRAPPPLRCC